jgi:hypothetical protein
MRLRSAVLASLFTALIAAVLPNAAGAAPHHNRGLTINVVPQRIQAGDGVVIYGYLKGAKDAKQTIRLYHRIPPGPGYTLVGTTTTNASGFYEFIRTEGVVNTDRSWFVRGPGHTHSRTVHEFVQALVSLSSDATSGYTNHPITFSGHVFPNHSFERVALQERTGAGDDWHTIKTSFSRAGSNFLITHRWRIPGAYDVRAVFLGDHRNVRSASDPVSVTIQQAQITGFTINTTMPVVDEGGSTAISGVLGQVGNAAAGDAGVPVTLMSRTAGTHAWTAVANATTAGDGSYQFPVQGNLQHNTWYVVRVTTDAKRHSAVVFEGVRDVVNAAPSANSGTTGQTITFTGTVLPGEVNSVVYLQRLGADGDWHTLAVGFTNALGAYGIKWALGRPGTDTFRVRALPDAQNLGGHSQTMAVQVSAPPATTLPRPS